MYDLILVGFVVTGAELKIPSSKSVTFSPYSALKIKEGVKDELKEGDED